jgi:uncharacterized repeat protein (TIGR02543 family)
MKKIYLLFIALFAGIIFFTGCKKDEYVVTFNPNGGRGAFITQSFTHKVVQPLMANSFTHSGYVFADWNTAADGNGIVYKDQESIKITAHTVLYAQWQLATGIFTVNFDANGGIGEMAVQTFEAGEPQPLSPNAFYFEGYMFTGWNTSPNGKGKSFTNEQNVTISQNMTLYAQWVPTVHTYFVLFDANGGEGVMEPQAFKLYEPQKLDSNIFTRENYLYKGWNTKADGSGYFMQDEATVQITGNTILYAQWEDLEGGDED